MWEREHDPLSQTPQRGARPRNPLTELPPGPTAPLRPDIRLVNAGGQSKAPTADQERGDEQKGESTARPRSYASARQRYTRGPRTPRVASRQTFRTGGSVHGTTRARLRGAPRDQPLAYASGARADTSCRPTSRLSTWR